MPVVGTLRAAFRIKEVTLPSRLEKHKQISASAPVLQETTEKAPSGAFQ
jgi:hypothetical protein